MKIEPAQGAALPESSKLADSENDGSPQVNANAVPAKLSHTSSSLGSHGHSSKVRPRLRAEGVMAPPASDAATLRRQVAALQADVEAHIEAEQRLQVLNRQLSERLEIYMKQNHDNLERAANEMNALHEDMEQTLELQRRLSKKASSLEAEKKELELSLQSHLQQFETERSSLRMQVSNLTSELIEVSQTEAEATTLQTEFDKTQAMNSTLRELIQKNKLEAGLIRQKAEDCKTRLQSLLAEERFNEEVGHRFERSLLRRCFKRLKAGVRGHRSIRLRKRAAEDMYQRSCCKEGFNALHLATQRSKKIRLANKKQTATFLHDLWREWRLVASVKKKFTIALMQQKRARMYKAFFGWKHLSCLSHSNCGQYTDLATKHWRGSLLKRTWDHWLLWIIICSKPKKKKLQEALEHVNDVTRWLALLAWKDVARQRRKKRQNLQRGLLHRRVFSIQAAFNKWQKGLRMNRAKNMLREKARRFRRGRYCTSVIRCWGKYVTAKKEMAELKTRATVFYMRALKRKELRQWKQSAQFQKAERKALLGFSQALLKTALGFWQDYHVMQSVKAKKEKKATVHRQRVERKILRNTLILWWERMVWKRHAAIMQQLLASWWQQFLLRSAFHSWLHSTFENALYTSSQCETELVQAKERCEKQRQRTTAVDVENLHLIDRLHFMSSEVAFLMLTINEKRGRRQVLQHALEDAALIESSMRGDLQQQKQRISELETEAAALQRGVQKKNSEDVAAEVHHSLHVQSLEQSLRDVQIHLSQKSSQVASYEKALKETAEKLEGTSDESHQKLSSAFQIAASLRLLLEERENQCAALEGCSRRRDLELEEVQRKLNMSSSAFAETLEVRDSRIAELEKLLIQKQAQIDEVQHDMRDVQHAINVHDGCHKKLEYEMKLRSSCCNGNSTLVGAKDLKVAVYSAGEPWGDDLREQQTCESWLA